MNDIKLYLGFCNILDGIKWLILDFVKLNIYDRIIICIYLIFNKRVKLIYGYVYIFIRMEFLVEFLK